MKQERCVLPVRCRKCSSVFDLWYDLQLQERLRQNGPVFPVSAQVAKLRENQSMCWDCRKNASFEELNSALEEYDFEFSFD